MPRNLDSTITTIGNLEHATKGLNKSLQMYVQLTGQGDDDSALIEITEVQMILPKNDEEGSYLVLRCK